MKKVKAFLGYITLHSKYVMALLIIGLAFYAGFFVCKHYDKNVVEVPIEVEKRVEVPIEIPLEVKGDTVVQYVEKETPQDADVEITSPAPVVSVSYNSQKTELEGVSGETQKFDRGKLQVEQKTEATLDVTPIVDREVNMAVDKQKLEDKAALDEAVQEEKHKAHKHGQKTFLEGLGTGVVLTLLF